MNAEGLSALLNGEPDLAVVGSATAAETGIRLAMALGPDVAVIGQRLEDGRGPDLARQLRARCADLPVVLLSTQPEEALLGEALEAGCSAVVSKRRKAEDLVATVRAAAAGRTLLCAVSARRLARSQRLGEGAALSKREIEVLQCLAEGLTNAEIGARLYLSTNTVGNHLYRMMRKLGARSKLGALVIGLQLGLIVLPEHHHA